MSKKLNANPTIFSTDLSQRRKYSLENFKGGKGASSYGDKKKIENGNERELFDALEIFDMIRDIQDPEHPLTLEQLNVLEVGNINVDDEKNRIEIFFTPTVPHCSMSVSTRFDGNSYLILFDRL